MGLFGKLYRLAHYIIFAFAYFCNYTDRLITNGFQIETNMVSNSHWIGAFNTLCSELSFNTAFIKISLFRFYRIPASR